MCDGIVKDLGQTLAEATEKGVCHVGEGLALELLDQIPREVLVGAPGEVLEGYGRVVPIERAAGKPEKPRESVALEHGSKLVGDSHGLHRATGESEASRHGGERCAHIGIEPSAVAEVENEMVVVGPLNQQLQTSEATVAGDPRFHFRDREAHHVCIVTPFDDAVSAAPTGTPVWLLRLAKTRSIPMNVRECPCAK